MKFTFYFKLNKYERLCDIYKLKYFENLNEFEIFKNIMKLTNLYQLEIFSDIYNEFERIWNIQKFSILTNLKEYEILLHQFEILLKIKFTWNIKFLSIWISNYVDILVLDDEFLKLYKLYDYYQNRHETKIYKKFTIR